MKINDFAKYLERLESTSSRIEITNILTELFKKSSSEEIDKVVYLSLGVLAPNYEGVLLNIAEKMMIRVIAKAYEVPEDKVKSEYKKTGDIGETAEHFSKAQDNQQKDATVESVYLSLLNIAQDSGEGSQERKVDKTSDLIKNLHSLAVRYVSRIPVGNLRLGFSEKTVLDALSKAFGVNSKDLDNIYNIRPDIGYVAKIVSSGNIKLAKPSIGVPVVPMLAQRLNSTSEMVKKMGTVSVEPKFDGLRIFIHYRKKGNYLKIFTRNMNSIDIETFPELKDVGKYIKADEVILDTEAIGVDPKREMFLDFQKTIQRRRKHDIQKNAEEIPLQFQVFDIILCDGKSLINTKYNERRELLLKVVVNGNLLRLDENTITSDPEVIKKLHEKYLKMGLEGIVAKRADGLYVSGRTGWNWVKMKEEEGKDGRLADTVDCVIMGYTSGKGKRVGFGVGQFLVGIYDDGVFKTVTKVGTGLTDDQFRELNERLKKISTSEMPKEYEVNKSLAPDYWVTPKEVVELAADEITVSPNHTSGYALRFPRLLNFRDDKSPKDATSLKELKDLYLLQKKN